MAGANASTVPPDSPVRILRDLAWISIVGGPLDTNGYFAH
jgi:hypothetical protein